MPDAGGSGVGRWDGEAYVAHADHHRSFDDWFLDRHPPRPGDDVIDLGSGSGEFTSRLATLVGDGSVVGVEPDPSMLATARTSVTADNVEFRRGRAQDLDEVCAVPSADLVVSRAVFHWIPLADYPRCYDAVRRVLRPGGWFHAESGGAGNAHRIREVLDAVATSRGLEAAAVTFPHAGIVLDLLEEAGFEVPEEGVRTVAQRRSFDRDELIGFLGTQAAPAYVADVAEADRAAFLAAVTEQVDDLRRHDGSYDQTFVRLEVLCRALG